MILGTSFVPFLWNSWAGKLEMYFCPICWENVLLGTHTTNPFEQQFAFDSQNTVETNKELN